MGRKREIRPWEKEIYKLKKENAELKEIIRQKNVDRENCYLLLGENVRLRRMMEIMDEEHAAMEKRVALEKERADKAQRGLKNLQKWLKIDGYKGADILAKTSDG